MLSIEQEYLSAVARIKSGRVTHPKLIKQAEQGKLKLNASNVALEAGRCRTLIATVDSPYRSVRAAIYGEREVNGRISNPPAGSNSLQVHLVRLRGRASDSEDALRILATKLVAAEMLVHELKKKVKKLEAKSDRLSAFLEKQSV